MASTGTKPSSTTPSSLNFLKEGLFLPGRNQRLFVAIFTILIAWSSLLLVANELGVEPIKIQVGRDMDTLMSTDQGGPDYAHLLQKTQDDYHILLLTSAAFRVSVDVTGSVIQLVSLFAAVTTYSGDGEVHSFGALLSRAKQQLKGSVLTVAFVCVIKTAVVALLLASSALVAFLAFRRYCGLFLAAGCLVFLVAFVFYLFLSFYCSLALVVAVDENAARRCCGASAIGRAWQLVNGGQSHAVLFVSVMSGLASVFTPIYWQAKICARSNMASKALLLGILDAVEMAAVELFQDCVLTVFYYECKGRSAQESQMEYDKLSIQDT